MMADEGSARARGFVAPPPAGTPHFQVFAIRYATLERRAAENFIGGDPHDGPMPMDYFVWAAVGEPGTFVIDTGFGPEAAKARNRALLASPVDGLNAVGVDAASVGDVILTHLHYDHAGSMGLFPRAQFHLQDAEMAFATGRLMRHGVLRHPYAVEDVVSAVRAVYAGRVLFHQGDREICPGLSVHRIGGHTAGLQAVRIATRGGWLVLASDASHFYANMNEGRPFPIVADVGAMLEGYERLLALASSPQMIVPGHDPAVMRRFAPVAGSGGMAVRLD
jgi:glyoxylase-like metal-dependent hydrolase (beta-lactamase superfamily II)